MIRRIVVLTLFLAVIPCIGQVAVPRPQRPDEGPLTCAPGDFPCQQRERDLQKARNKERFANLKKDTDRLLLLAQELKSAVDKANENTLSLEVIRKTDEIEKLARSVRGKMKNSY